MQSPEFHACLTRPSCSVAEAAAMLRMSRQGVLNAIERGDIKATRVGKRIIVPTAPLRKMLLIDESSTQAVPPAAA